MSPFDPFFAPDEPVPHREDGPVTEGWAAELFVARYQHMLRYDHDAGVWSRWNGNLWQRERTGLAFSFAHRLAKNLARSSEKAKQEIGASKAAFAGGVEKIAQTDRAFAVTSDIWDTNQMLLGTPGGTVDLHTGKLLPPQQSDYISKATSCAPAETDDCPAWKRFLHDATLGDLPYIAFLQRWFGYCLTGLIREHAMVFIYGAGGNGKTTAISTVKWLMGDYAIQAPVEALTTEAIGRHTTDIAMMKGARAVFASETEEGSVWAESRIKTLTGGDPITARFMRQDNITFDPTHKLCVIGNHQPVLRNVTEAMTRRLLVPGFLYKPTNPDKSLEDKLRAEGPSILRWLINGCLDYLAKDGLHPPEAVTRPTKQYFAEQDIFGQWLTECCERNANAGASTKALYESWRQFTTGQDEPSRTSRWFTATLRARGFRDTKDCEHFRGRGFRGLRLLSDWEQEP